MATDAFPSRGLSVLEAFEAFHGIEGRVGESYDFVGFGALFT